MNNLPSRHLHAQTNNGNNRKLCEICSKYKDTTTTSMISFWCLYCWFWTDFTHCYLTSIVKLWTSTCQLGSHFKHFVKTLQYPLEAFITSIDITVVLKNFKMYSSCRMLSWGVQNYFSFNFNRHHLVQRVVIVQLYRFLKDQFWATKINTVQIIKYKYTFLEDY